MWWVTYVARFTPPPDGKGPPDRGPRVDTARLRDITGIEKLPPRPPSHPDSIWLWTVAGVLVALTLAGWWIFRRRRRVKPVPAESRARQEIECLDQWELATADQRLAYLARLSGIVRDYLQQRYGLPATQRTTQEFFHSLLPPEPLTPEQQELLRTLMDRWDLAKYARTDFPAAECRRTAALAMDFVQQTARPTPANSNNHSH